MALQHLSALQGETGLWRLKEALADPQLRQFAAKGITKIARGREDPALADALAAAAREESRDWVLTTIVDALVAMGAAGAGLLAELGGQLGPYDVMRLSWLAEGITPRAAAERLVAAGAVPPPSDARLQEVERQWHADRDAGRVVISLLDKAGRMAWFDTEAGRVTPDYLHLMTHFLVIGRGIFEADTFSQSVDQASGASQVRFRYAGKEHTFTAQDMGDWYDVPSVLAGLNRALASVGRPERFIPVNTGDQTTAVTLVPETPFRQLAQELRLPLEEDAGAGSRRGLGYEAHVRQVVAQDAQRGRRGQRPGVGLRLRNWLLSRRGKPH